MAGRRRPAAPLTRGGAATRLNASRDGAARRGAPRGEGSLAREVDEIQRARVLAALQEIVVEEGFPAAAVARIVARVGISRRTFYELFSDREDCFLAAFDAALAQFAARGVPAFLAPGRWSDRIRAALTAGLELLDEAPDLGALCIVHTLNAGPRTRERRARVVRRLVDAVDAVDEGRHEAPSPARPRSRLTAEGIVGAVLSILYTRLVDGDRESFASLTGPLMGMIVLPYLGQAAARRERQRPAPKLQAAKPRVARSDPLEGLRIRLTYRTVRVLLTIREKPGSSNRVIGDAAGIVDQGQTSKLLRRLESLGLIERIGPPRRRGEPNAWRLTPRGEQLQRTLSPRVSAEASRGALAAAAEGSRA